MKRLTLILILSALLAVGCYDRHDEPPSGEFSAQANCDIGTLRQLCEGDGFHLVTEEFICVGRITSSDREGNFYRSIVVEEGSGGAEVKLGAYNLASQYPVGLMVALHLKGTALAVENGVVQIGLPPQSFDSSPREMEAQAVIDRHIIRSTSVEPMSPLCCDLGSLDTSLCGRLLRIEGIRYSPLEEDDASDYYRFVDENSNAIFIYISSYAEFADIEFGDDTLAIQGVLYHESVGRGIGKQFVLKPRFNDDFSPSGSSF